MRSLAALVYAAVAIGSPCFGLRAQGTVIAETRVNLRRDSSTERTPIRVLKALERLEVTGAARNGFLPVRTERSETGWVSSDYVYPEGDEALNAAAPPLRVIGLDAPAGAISPNWERPPVGKSTLRHDPDDGTRCGARGADGGDWETFILKNRSDVPTVSHAVTFAALEALPFKTGGLGADRADTGWTKAQKAAVGRFEGIPLTITGFLAAVKQQAGSSGGEGTNCKFTGEANTDWHMALVRTHRDSEPNALVVEPTPRIKRKHPNWTKPMLAPWSGDERQRTDSVRITGFLFYDPDHANHLRKYRRTMWELHPVTRIEVFQNGAWVDVDDMQGPP